MGDRDRSSSFPVKIAGVVLAAGEGRRIGGPKALLRFRQRTFLAHVVDVLREGGAPAVLAVVGCDAERVVAEAALPADVVVVHNPAYREGMLTSVLAGLDAAEAAGADAVLLHPVDHPLVAPATVARVVSALLAGARIAVPSFSGRRGHPGGFARSVWPHLRSASKERGARAVLQDHPDWIVHVPGDPGCLQGINTPEDYARLIEQGEDSGT